MVDIINTSKCVTKDAKAECFKDMCLMDWNIKKKLEIVESNFDNALRNCQNECQAIKLCRFWTSQQHASNANKTTCKLYNFPYNVRLEDFLEIPKPNDVLKCVSGPQFCCKENVIIVFDHTL